MGEAATESSGTPEYTKENAHVYILRLTIFIEGKEPMVISPDVPGSLEKFTSSPLDIPGGAKYHTQVRFRVNHKPVKGLRYILTSKKAGITVSKVDELLGDYEPSTEENPEYVYDLPEKQAPGNYFLRGHYPSTSVYVDGDGTVLREVAWIVNITA